ncbi:DNA-binding transcriptional LysR family regulator [Ancylobacter sp. 3268]|uniref:LysR family transcriptional regulator n=1 Tax=Ancylobacter sp. 3268 TaxID=2817752 RepID=UPI0028583811|nr:LysR family transcriptional regulator [Ancylobacter sp. 3268]MDR6952468.1 DNA-binding transcriptional LysR family regulator [Ancylobacter sp. 3268]
MDWDHLRVFLAVARAGQMLAAARQLGLDHATVGRRIGALETGLGAKLIARRTTGSALTPAGERLLEHAEKIETELLQAQSALGNANLALSGTVRIGAPDGFGVYFLAPRLGELAERYPGLTIQLAPLPRSFSLPKREVDIAVTLQRPHEGRLVARKLTDYSLGIYAASDYLERTGPIGHLTALTGRTLVTYVEDLLYSPALDYFETFRAIEARRIECASVVGQMEAVRAGAGVGILHDYAAQRHSELVKLLPEHSFRRSYWLVAHADVHELRRIREVESFIVEAVRAARAGFVAEPVS